LFRINFWTRVQFPPSPLNTIKNLFKEPLVNKRIRSQKVRVIDANGEQLGILNTEEALRISRERNLDLVQVADKTDPPVCKIIDYGKYLYLQEKKKKKEKKVGALKGIRIGFNISHHDLETKARIAEKFLKKGDKVKIEMRLRGREKALGEFAKKKMNEFLEILKEKVPFKVERGLKKKVGNLTIIISKE